MRIFWTIVAILALVAAFVFPMSGNDAPQGAPIVAQGPETPSGPVGMSSRDRTPSDSSNQADATPQPISDSDAESAADDLENHSGSAETPVVEANQNSLSENEGQQDVDPVDEGAAMADAGADAASTDPEGSEVASNDEDPDEFLDPETLESGSDADADPNAALAATDSTDPTSGPKFSPDPVELEVREDGSTLVNGNYVIRGDGSMESPYLITWDHLISASQDYIPREGLDVIPPQIAMLHDKWVKIVGYYIFPMFVAEVNEALVMQNQWDGCCIGVPPSVYDSVEVRFQKPRSMKRGHFALYGEFTGRLMVDPYIANRWLIGLYLLEEADLKVDL